MPARLMSRTAHHRSVTVICGRRGGKGGSYQNYNVRYGTEQVERHPHRLSADRILSQVTFCTPSLAGRPSYALPIGPLSALRESRCAGIFGSVYLLDDVMCHSDGTSIAQRHNEDEQNHYGWAGTFCTLIAMNAKELASSPIRAFAPGVDCRELRGKKEERERPRLLSYKPYFTANGIIHSRMRNNYLTTQMAERSCAAWLLQIP